MISTDPASGQLPTGEPHLWGNTNRIADTWGNWLRSFPWTLYGHLTFKSPHSEGAAIGKVRKLHHRLNRWTLGVHYYKRRAGVRCFVAVERTEAGAVHLHFLAEEVDVARIPAALLYWRRTGGDTVIVPYDPELLGAFYVSKRYRNEEGANVHLLGRWDSDTRVPA